MDEDNTCMNYHSPFVEDSKAEWTRVMVSKLIDMYRDRRILYDAQIPSNIDMRNANIHQMALELGISGLFVFFYSLLYSNVYGKCNKIIFVTILWEDNDTVPDIY